MASNATAKISCGQCNLPFWSEEQLQKHLVTHKRRKTFFCTYCEKGFVRGDRLKMHERSCDKNPVKKNTQRISAYMQIGGGGATHGFSLLESAFNGVLQTWRYEFSDEEQQDVYGSLQKVVKSTAYDLVIEATGVFKWYLGLKVIFHKASDPNMLSDPPPFFQSYPTPSYHKYDDETWDIVKEQLEKQIENYECNGSGWVLSRLVTLDVTFAEMENPLKPNRGKDEDDDENKDDEDY